MNRSFLSLSLPVVCCILLSLGCAQKIEKPQLSAPEVVVEEVIVRDVQPFFYTTGTTAPFQKVEIPARVAGYLREIRYEVGDLVSVGAPLFLIQQEQYEAELKSAQANLASAQAQLQLSEANLKRTQSLIAQGAMTEQDLDTDSAKRDVAAAEVMRAQAALETAKLNLAYTDVRSPIMGKTNRNLVDIGNMVGVNGNVTLTTVVGMDPIYVYFDISDTQFNEVREYAKKHKDPTVMSLIKKLHETKQQNMSRPEGLDSITAVSVSSGAEQTGTNQRAEALAKDDWEVSFEIGFIKGSTPNEGEYPFKGVIDMTSNEINESTGTIMVRGEIPNEDYMIFPGQICRVRIPIPMAKDALLVKQESICTDLNQSYVYVVDEKNIARRRPIELGIVQPDGTRRVRPTAEADIMPDGTVKQGLRKGERIIVSGTQKVRDGLEVKPMTVQETQTKPAAQPEPNKEDTEKTTVENAAEKK